MSEYMERHAVSRLIGAPPGYVGYDRAASWSRRSARSPTPCCCSRDREGAPDVFDILLQVMDRATLTDNQGREADFRHVTLIMTSNAGAGAAGARHRLRRRPRGRRPQGARAPVQPRVPHRLDEIVRFDDLAPEVMGRVVDKFVRELEEQLRERKVKIELSAAARAWLAEKGYDRTSARARWHA